MSDQRISEMTALGAALRTDEFPVSRTAGVLGGKLSLAALLLLAQRPPVATITTTQAIPDTSFYVRFTGGSGQTLTLPAANIAGAGFTQPVVVKNLGTASVTIAAAAGGDTVDTVASISLPVGAGIMFLSDGVSAWESN